MLVAALMTDLAMRIIWIPLMHVTWCITQESSNLVKTLLITILKNIPSLLSQPSTSIKNSHNLKNINQHRKNESRPKN